MKYIVILLILFTSCNKEKQITYVVDSIAPCYISFTNEFGTSESEHATRKMYSTELHWKKEILYNPDKFGPLKEISLYASTSKDYPCYVHAKIFVDNKLVADSTMYADEEGDKSVPVYISYEL